MPVRPKKACAYPRCPEVIPAGQRFCDNHRKQEYKRQARERKDTEEQSFYHSPRWRKLRAWKLRRDPLCEVCEAEGRTKEAKMVHHIKDIKDGGELMAVDNLASLCGLACHNKLHQRGAVKEGGQGGLLSPEPREW